MSLYAVIKRKRIPRGPERLRSRRTTPLVELPEGFVPSESPPPRPEGPLGKKVIGKPFGPKHRAGGQAQGR